MFANILYLVIWNNKYLKVITILKITIIWTANLNI